MSKKYVAGAGKGIALVISNEEMDDISRIKKFLESSSLLIDWVSKIVKH